MLSAYMCESRTTWCLDLRVFKAVYHEKLAHLNNCIGESFVTYGCCDTDSS